MTIPRKTALCLTGGGVTGGLYQVGALSALETVFENPSFDLYVGTSSGAALSAGLAGGLTVQRLYRALIDPADNYFRLERSHVLALDAAEWKRTVVAGLLALRRGFASLIARTPAPMPSDLWEQMERLYDALPAGLFSLDRFERFLADFFLRRQVPNSFRAIEKELLITATDLDGGQPALFGAPGLDHVPISLACAASMALPVFFSPVRIGERHYVDGGVGATTELDVACERGAGLVVVLNPNVPVHPESGMGVPTGHGAGSSVRDKGLMWVYNQSMRTGVYARVNESYARVQRAGGVEVLLLQPDPIDAVRFMHNVASVDARREILQWAHRSARQAVRRWAEERPATLDALGWKLANPQRLQPPTPVALAD